MRPIRQSDIDWDVVWDYTMGLPEENGFEKILMGTPDITMKDNGLNIVCDNNQYVRYTPVGFETCDEGVYEISFSVEYSNDKEGIRLILSDGEKGAQFKVLQPNVKQLFLASEQNGGIYNILEIKLGQEYKLRISRIAGINTAYLNDDEIYSTHIAATSFTTSNRLFFQYTIKAILKSIKFKNANL